MKCCRILAVSLLTCASGALFVQGQPTARKSSKSVKTSETQNRKIVSGDQIRVTVKEMDSLNKIYPVAGDGTIDLGELGRVEIEDTTPKLAANAIKDYLESQYFKRATVTVTISEFVQGEVRITGAVNSATVIPFTGDKILTLFESIIRAGGLQERANASMVKILRWKPGMGLQREVVTIDVSEMFTDHNFDNDEYLRPRDIVFVPTRTGEDSKEILYIGAVGKVGYHQWYTGMNVLRLVANTGGVGENAQGESARILRPNGDTGDYTPIATDINALLAHGDMDQNHALKPGDIVYVPSRANASSGQAFALGEVGRRGPIPLPLKGELGVARSLLNVGFTPLSNQNRVKLIRKTEDGQKREIFINVKKILDTGDFEDDIPLQDGDIILVPVSNINLPILNRLQP